MKSGDQLLIFYISANNLEFQINELVVALRSNGNLSNVNLSSMSLVNLFFY